MPGTTTLPQLTDQLDRLSLGPVHRRAFYGITLALCFEIADINAFTYVAPALEQYQHLSVQAVSWIASASFLGMFVGATVGGWFADRVGRRRALVISTIWYSLFSLLNALAPDVAAQMAARVLTGIGMGALTVVAITLLSEIMPRDKRGRMQGLALGIAVIGVPAMSFLARGVDPLGPDGWRLVFCFGALGFAALIFILRVPESPRWLLHRGKTDRAAAALATLARGADLRPAAADPGPAAAGPAATAPARAGLRWVFGDRTLASRTIMLWIVWTFQTLGFFGFSVWVPTLLEQRGVGLAHSLTFSAVTTLGAIPGSFLVALVAERGGRKIPLIVVSIAIVICGLLYGLTLVPAAIMIFGFLVELFMWTTTGLLYAYTPELYPTGLRNTGSGIAYGIGRLVNIAGAPIVALIYSATGYVWVFAYVAICWTIVAVAIAVLGPRTAAAPLESLQQREA